MMPPQCVRLFGWTLSGIGSLALACSGPPAEAPLTSAQERSPQVQATLVEAAVAYQRGNLLMTEQLLRTARSAAPDDPDIALDLGDTLNRLQRMDSARRHYDEFLARHPSASPVRLALGLTLMGLGRWEESADQIARVVEGRPEDSVARFNLGIVLAKLGRYEEALPHLRRAAELSPADPGIHTELGIVLLRLGKPGEAEKALQRALELDPGKVSALFNLGQCYTQMGRHEDAQNALERFSRASAGRERFIDQKRLFRSVQARAESLAREGKSDESLEALLAFREPLEDFPLFQQEVGVAYLRLGRRQEAIASFERAVAGDPALTESHSHLAVLYQQDGQSEKAMKARQAAARPASPGPLPAESP